LKIQWERRGRGKRERGKRGRGKRGRGKRGRGIMEGSFSPGKYYYSFQSLERGRGVSMVYSLAILHQPVHSTNRPLAGTQYQSAISWYTVTIGH
jgi:hypothetical protein